MKKKIFIIAGALFMLTVIFVNVKVALGKTGPQTVSVSLTKSALADGEGGEWWEYAEDHLCFIVLGHCMLEGNYVVCSSTWLPMNCTPEICHTEITQQIIDECTN